MWKRLGSVTASALSLAVLLACANGAEEPADDGGPTPGSPGIGVNGLETNAGESSPPQAPSAPAPNQAEDPQSPQIEMPEADAEIVEDMVQENSVGWEDYEVTSETELRFLATSGNQACYGQRYQVEETADEVAVAIIIGNRADGAEICTQEAVFIAVPVELEEPLGDRDVVELEDPELAE